MLKSKIDLIEWLLNINSAPKIRKGVNEPAIILLLWPALISPKTYGVKAYANPPNKLALFEAFKNLSKKKSPIPPKDK